MKHLSAVLLLAGSMVAQDLPDAPAPQAVTQPTQPTYSKQLWIATGVNAGAKIADLTQTCIVLGAGGHEHWLPTQSCGGVAGWVIGAFAASQLVSWYLAKHNHPKLAVTMQYLSAGGNVAGFTYTRMHWR